MQVNEVRIGNIVAIPLQDSTTTSVAKQIKAITVFGELDFSTKGAQEVYSANHCIGVQLTDGWLLRMGFESVKGVYTKDSIKIANRNGAFFMEYILPKMESVHQLQNAYYARTGDELSIKNLS